MEENKFLYSDASYCNKTKTASISVYDLQQDSYENKIYKNVKNNFIAEEMALKTSIMLSISREYRNVVFIYDSINIDCEKLKIEYEHFFDKAQFLWLKREFLNKVDSSAKKALKECFVAKEKAKIQEENKICTLNKIKELRKKPIEHIIDYFENNILNSDEISLLKNIKSQKISLSKNKKYDLEGLRALMSLIESSKISNEFYLKIFKVFPEIKEYTDFRKKLSSVNILKLAKERSPEK